MTKQANPVNMAVNVGTSHGHSVKEVVDMVNKIIHNGDMKVRVTGRRDGDVPYLVADNTKAHDLLGFIPSYTLRDIIGSMK